MGSFGAGVPHKSGWAFGLGLERIAMVLFSIPDIRLFWSQDSRFSSQFKSGAISTFKPYSKYPECYKDLAFWLPTKEGGGSGWHENDFMELVRDEAGDLVEGVDLVSFESTLIRLARTDFVSVPHRLINSHIRNRNVNLVVTASTTVQWIGESISLLIPLRRTKADFIPYISSDRCRMRKSTRFKRRSMRGLRRKWESK